MILEERPNITIDLKSPDGNAFAVLALVDQIGRKIGLEKTKIRSIRSEMMGGDYEHLIQVFDREFGSIVTIYR